MRSSPSVYDLPKDSIRKSTRWPLITRRIFEDENDDDEYENSLPDLAFGPQCSQFCHERSREYEVTRLAVLSKQQRKSERHCQGAAETRARTWRRDIADSGLKESSGV
jgi:hypothetical protein